ncbi:ADOP family duplicated permease [Dokdonella sp.]|uniref:ADOP family duplicated permease n=1 Tax=Dokdonella sp. TaxID=2291710 RepID=UPI001B19E6BD|nr:ADOP family duplicated permease [Dokdonella sp.]MBO9663907.1 ABC transporter permease [Dokdonella sp.]
MPSAAHLRQVLRGLLRQPGFSLFTISTLAIGIAVAVTLFSAVHSLLLSPVSGLRDADRLIEITGRSDNGGYDTFSAPDYADLAARTHDVADLVAYRYEAMNLTRGGEPQRAMGVVVSGNYFATLGIAAHRGRLIAADDDRNGAAPVVVASFAAWRKFFDGDESVIGKPVSINGQSFTLVGVSAPEFRGTLTVLAPMFYAPLHQLPLLQPAAAQRLDQRTTSWLALVARLAPGATAAVAAERLGIAANELEASYPRADRRGRIAIEATALRGVPGFLRGGLIAFSALLFALTGMLLLLACVNVASMLLARGEARRGEIALRYVLGATRRRIAAGLVGENLLLALAAAAVGLALGVAACRLLARVDLPTPVPVSIDIPIDAAAFAFALGCALVCTLAMGLLPALRVSATAPAANEALAASTRATGGRSRLGATLVVTQIALTMVLLAGGALFLHALQRAATIDLGFDARNVVAADFDLEPSGYATPRQLALQDELLERARAVPGIEHAALAAEVPLNLDRMMFGDFDLGGERVTPFANLVSPGFFATLRADLQGRDFDARDRAEAAPVCIVNGALARRLAPGGDVLGRTFAFGDPGETPKRLTVIGVVPNGKYSSLTEVEQPFLFLPLAQWPHARTSLLARGTLPIATAAQSLRETWRALDPGIPAPSVRSFDEILGLSLLPQKIAGFVSGALGLVGLLLAAVGLYGLISIQVARRTREIGVRLALGASPRRILSEILRRGARLSALGLAAGGILAGGGALLVSELLFGLDLGTFAAFVGAASVLAATALVASWLPARRAARIQPVEALRYE